MARTVTTVAATSDPRPVLITGATGFLGHHLVPALQVAGYRLRALVRPTSDVRFLQARGVALVVAADIRDGPALRRACAGCRAVVHAAGHFRFWGRPADFWRTNVGGTAALLAAAAGAGVGRIIHVSSLTVVGRTPAGTIDETTPCRPQDHYQRSKLVAEQLALARQRRQGLPVLVLRPGALYGPWGRYAFNRLFFEEPLRGWRIQVHGGRRLTFPAYAPDVARGVQAALTRGRPGAIYHLCGPSLSHRAANDIISDLAGISRRRLEMPAALVLALARLWTAASHATRREPFYPLNMAPYVFQDWRVTAARAAAELGFTATPFAIGARETLQWYRRTGLIP